MQSTLTSNRQMHLLLQETTAMKIYSGAYFQHLFCYIFEWHQRYGNVGFGPRGMHHQWKHKQRHGVSEKSSETTLPCWGLSQLTTRSILVPYHWRQVVAVGDTGLRYARWRLKNPIHLKKESGEPWRKSKGKKQNGRRNRDDPVEAFGFIQVSRGGNVIGTARLCSGVFVAWRRLTASVLLFVQSCSFRVVATSSIHLKLTSSSSPSWRSNAEGSPGPLRRRRASDPADCPDAAEVTPPRLVAYICSCKVTVWLVNPRRLCVLGPHGCFHK